jgi:hypothetical protein
LLGKQANVSSLRVTLSSHRFISLKAEQVHLLPQTPHFLSQLTDVAFPLVLEVVHIAISGGKEKSQLTKLFRGWLEVG